jgi:predicted restriction endonuclease
LGEGDARSFFGLLFLEDGIVDESREIEEDQVEKEILQRTLEGPVEKLQLVKSRRGQGVFRDNVIQIEKFCRVTGVRVIDHLRASHIKPWAKSDDQEKVDGNNGLLLSPHVDHLFDRGWIRFEADGTMITSPKLDPSVLPSWRIEPVWEKFPFNSIQIEYLTYHAESVFQE